MIREDFAMSKTSLKDKEFYETMHYLKMEREKHNNFKSNIYTTKRELEATVLKILLKLKASSKKNKKKNAYDNYVLDV